MPTVASASALAVDTVAVDTITGSASGALRAVLADTLHFTFGAVPEGLSSDIASWFVPALIGLLGALAGAIVAAWYQKKALEAQRHEEERRDIYRKLNEFYGPVSVLLHESAMWHSLFKNDGHFRTLTELIKGRRFTGDDKALLDEIRRTTDQISVLIVDKGGLVEEEPSDLTELLSKARTHYRLLHLATEGKLTEDASRYEAYVYPKALDDAIRTRKAELEARLRVLNNAPPPSKAHG